jgi:hypothetical protein
VKAAASGVEVSRLDNEAAALRTMNLRPAVLTAGLAEIEKERAELLARAAGKRDQKEGRARQMLSRTPELVRAYRTQVQQAAKLLAREDVVAEASEAVRRLLADGRIVLAPSADHTAVVGPVHFKELGDHVLELAGWQRNRRDINDKLSGSGGPLRAL